MRNLQEDCSRIERILLNKDSFYILIFFIIEFFSLVVMTCYLYKSKSGLDDHIFILLFTLIFAYEAYAHVGFTKVAAYVGSAGFLLLLSDNTRNIEKICGGVCIFISIIIRYQIAEALIGIWGLTIMLETLGGFTIIQTRKIRILLYKIILWSLALLIFTLVPIIKNLNEEDHAYWEQVWKWNDYRATCQDYQDEDKNYLTENYDVTLNDFQVWYNWNDDCYKLDDRLGSEIISHSLRNIGLIDRVFGKEQLEGFFKVFPLAFFSIDVFWVVIIALLVIASLNHNRKGAILFVLVSMVGILLLLNYYLYINGRYLMHRVDVAIILNLIFAGIYLTVSFDCRVMSLTEKQRRLCLLSMIMSVMLVFPYEHYSDDISYISDRSIETNRAFFETTCLRSDDVFLIGNDRDDRAQNEMCFKPFEPHKTGLKKNIIMGATPENAEVRRSNGISNPYLDIVDNEKMFFVLSEDNKNTAMWERYFSDTIGREVQLVETEHLYNRTIYRVRTKNTWKSD